MKRWLNGIGPFRAPEDEVPSGGTGTGTGTEGEVPKVFKIAGKDIPVETLEASLNLYNSMSDPELSKEIIGTLADRMGLLNKDGKLKGDREAAGDKIETRFQKLLKTKLGKDYEKFADTLGPLLDEGIQEYLNEHKSNTDGARSGEAWADAVDRFTGTHQLTPEVSAEMERIIKRNGGRPDVKGKAALEYLDDMYSLAVRKLGGVVQEDVDDRSDDDEEDERPAPRRRRPAFRYVQRPANPTIDQIVDAAMKGQRFK